MHGLEKSVNTIAAYETDKKTRERAIELLNEVISDIEQGIGIWRGYLNSATGSVDNGGYGGWAGFTIESDLFDLHMTSRGKAWELSNGGASLDTPLVNLAYAKLKEGQSGTDAANEAIADMDARVKQIQGFIETIRTTKPQKVKAETSSASNKSVASKSASKKSTSKKSAAKKSAPKKTAPKKSVAKKKAAKKSSKKKVAAKKTAVKKKTTAKKTTAKKAVKKKVTQKKAAKKKVVKKKVAQKKLSKKKAVKKKIVKKKVVAKKSVKKKAPVKKASIKKKAKKK